MLRAASKLVALSLFIAQAACGGALTEPFTPPESGGAPWVEVASKHVVLRTDLPADEAREACVEFERIYLMFEDIAFPYAEKPKAQTSIVLFRREAEYRAIAPKSSIGYFYRGLAIDEYFEPTAVFFGDLTAATRLTFQHELTHRFIDFYFPSAPLWVEEGMADYYSTMVVEDNKVLLGRDLPNRFFIGGLTWTFESTPLWPTIAHVPIGDARSVSELIEMDREAFYIGRSETSSPSEEEQNGKRRTANYASAWALVHLLLNGPDPYPKLFATYLQQLASGLDPISAWQDTFGGVDQEIQSDYRAWLIPKTRILRVTSYELPAAEVLRERVMDPSDVHVLWASLRPWSSDAQRARARADLDAAIRLDPKKASPRIWMAKLREFEGELEDAERHLKGALTAAPDDQAATYALFRLLVQLASQGGGEDRWAQADAMLPKVVAVATSAKVQSGAARYLAIRGRTDEGLPLALRAVRADPSCWQCFDTLAMLLAQKGSFGKAAEVQSIAVGLLPEGVKNTGLVESLRRYKAAARKRSKEPPPACAPDASCPSQAPAGP